MAVMRLHALRQCRPVGINSRVAGARGRPPRLRVRASVFPSGRWCRSPQRHTEPPGPFVGPGSFLAVSADARDGTRHLGGRISISQVATLCRLPVARLEIGRSLAQGHCDGLAGTRWTSPRVHTPASIRLPRRIWHRRVPGRTRESPARALRFQARLDAFRRDAGGRTRHLEVHRAAAPPARIKFTEH